MLEAISYDIPVVSWPCFAGQFCNEKLVVQVLEIGVRIVAECSIPPKLADENGVLVKKEDVEKAINELMEEEEPESLRRC